MDAFSDLAGRVALITGTTSGLGRHAALTLAKAGVKVAITGRRVVRLDGLAKEIAAAGGICHPIALDVTDLNSIKAAADLAEQELGPVSILVNNAGLNAGHPNPVKLTEEDFNTVMNTNVKGALFMATEIAKRLIARKEPGRIVNIASIGAHTVLPGLTLYCLSKAAVAMMTKGLARDWARHHINVNAICPGYFETEINSDWFKTDGGQAQIQGFPRRRLMEAADLDGLLLFLTSVASAATTGGIFTIDDGQSLGGVG